MKNIITYFKFIILSILLCICLTGCTLEVTLDQNRANTNKEISKLDSTKFKHGDVLDTIPDSSNSVLFFSFSI